MNTRRNPLIVDQTGEATQGGPLRSRRHALAWAATGVAGGAVALSSFGAGSAAAAEDSGVIGVSIFLPEAYNAVGDGVTNDAAAIQAAIDAAAGMGGGVVVLQATYAWAGPITVKNGVKLTANSSNGRISGAGLLASEGEPPHLVALDGASQIKLGEWLSGNTRPGGLERLRINGNGMGGPAGLVRVEGESAYCESVQVANSHGGPAWYLDGAKSCTFIGCDTYMCEGGAWLLNRGASNNGWFRCQCHSNRWACWITGTTSDASAPSNNSFVSCLFENGDVTIEHVVRADCGVGNKFAGMDLVSCKNEASNLNKTIVYVTRDAGLGTTHIEVESCHFAGAQAKPYGIRIKGDDNVVTVSGDTWMHGTDVAFAADGGASSLRLIGNLYSGNGVHYATINNGSTAKWAIDRDMGYAFVIPDTISPNVLTARPSSGSATARFELDRDGLHVWNSASASGGSSSLGFDSANRNLVVKGGLMISGRLGRTFSDDVSVTLPATVVAIDASKASAHAIIITGSGSVGSLVVTGGVDGARLMLQVSATTDSQSVVWAVDMRFNGDVAPVIQRERWLTLDFVRQGNLWLEVSRTLVPSS